ncbi:MAG TPA: hypothetical protein VMU19_00165, partial [Bryobacteraceae bacterium]|nr:hypothetical protein [Bryobacteraceae bacterium]
ATERSYFRNLKELRRLQTQRIDAEIHAAEIAACAGPAPTQTPAKPAAEANPQTPDQPATVLESAEIGGKNILDNSTRFR